MSVLSRYLHQPHPSGCDCSVCASRLVAESPVSSRFTQCTVCRPTRVYPVVTTMARVWGVWRSIHSTYRVERGSTCEKHMPARRPPKYWHVVYDSGKPTPFVPVHEPFELVS
ncbi:MAG: hypothetical protein CTR55_13800 [Pseudomonas sp.]|uniref:lysogeny maintenance protein PflM n=1 Tax=Pseudomonas sp. TaxID=306 RepID=UPI000CAE32D9|nr:DUF5447 family protein [Pseudomonas sp.]PJI48725.1 MAG: hypothetical protein CTR55_13800 [Pseudomonas sp.]